MGTQRFKAVLFDLGGVVLGSPLHAIAAYEHRVMTWEKTYPQVLDDGQKRAALLRMMPQAERQGELRRMVALGVD